MEGETIESICVRIQRSGDGDTWGIISKTPWDTRTLAMAAIAC